MTKADLVDEVIRVADVSKKDAETIVNTVFVQIGEALRQNDKIELRGFGSFRIRRRRSRQGRNPKTGDRVDVPSKRIPYFKPGKELKDLINGEAETGAAPADASASPRAEG
jgi:integration host factor subunit beta